MSFKEQQIKQWLDAVLDASDFKLIKLVDDASFRQYYRVQTPLKNYVLMDAPPTKEKPDVFFRVARLMKFYQLTVPECFFYEQELGLLLISDFGNEQLYQRFSTSKDEALPLYDMALETLEAFLKIDSSLVPQYEYTKFLSEVSQFSEWFLPYIEFKFSSASQQKVFDDLRHQLASMCCEQPQVFIHRDYHSKNLMVLDTQQLGMIDFQDAVRGPITYDLVSLLRDCYVSLDEAYVAQKIEMMYQKFTDILGGCDYQGFVKWFDWTGLQRHLKCLGIFTRLSLRDKRDNYLQHIPRVVGYVEKVLKSYSEFDEFQYFWMNDLCPLIEKSLIFS